MDWDGWTPLLERDDATDAALYAMDTSGLPDRFPRVVVPDRRRGLPVATLSEAFQILRMPPQPYFGATEATKLARQYIEALAEEIRPLLAAETAANSRAEQGRYPHACPRCAGPAYRGLNVIDCAKGCE